MKKYIFDSGRLIKYMTQGFFYELILAVGIFCCCAYVYLALF